MAIYVETTDPKQLLTDIKKEITEGRIATWSIDKDGDFTHNVDQWRNCAWFQPRIKDNKLILGIMCRKDRNMSVLEYAVYHGRFVEMLLAHFDKTCNNITATSKVTIYDRVKPSNPTK